MQRVDEALFCENCATSRLKYYGSLQNQRERAHYTSARQPADCTTPSSRWTLPASARASAARNFAVDGSARRRSRSTLHPALLRTPDFFGAICTTALV